MHAGDGALLGRRLKGTKGLALLGAAAVLIGALLVSIDDGSASDGAVSLASAAPSKIAFIGASTDPGGEVRFELYVINADGSGSRGPLETARATLDTVQYELTSDPTWSPDGRTIAFAGMDDDDNTDVYVVGADGLGEQRLTRHPGVDANPAWSPDGRKIAFTRRVGDYVPPGKTHIYVMNADGSGQRRLAQGYVHFSVAWSPDVQKMLFERPNPRHPAVGANPKDFAEDLHVMNADGSGQRNLTRRPVRDVHPAWSPDGRRISFARGRQAWVMNADGSGQRSLTPAAGWRSDNPDWSPGGRKIAFEARASTSPHDGIFVSNADGSERRRLTKNGGDPAWSPDGRKIAFLTERDRYSELYTMNADGSGQRNLTRSAGTDLRFAWSPDGKMIAFDRHLATDEELYVINADGSGKRRVMRSDGWSGWGVPDPWWAWSPTPKRQ